MAMTRSLTSTIALTIQQLYKGVLDLTETKDTTKFTVSKVLASGTGANQANRYFARELSIDASADATVVLTTNDAGEDSLGQALALTQIKGLLIENTSNVSLEIGASGGATEWLGLLKTAGDVIKLPPYGTLFVLAPAASGMAISTDTSLKIKNLTAAAAVVNLLVIGVT
jgi:hypothetical protein